MYAANLDR